MRKALKTKQSRFYSAFELTQEAQGGVSLSQNISGTYGSTSVANRQWRSAALPAAYVADSWYGFYNLQPSIHRRYVIPKITITFKSDNALPIDVMGVLARLLANTVDGASGTIGIANMFQNYIMHCYPDPVTFEGSITFDFTSLPEGGLTIRYGEQLLFSYCRSTALHVRWDVNVWPCYNLTNDTNYNEENVILIVSDSIGGITAVAGDLEYSNRSGVERGVWPVFIQKKLAEVGIGSRILNISQAGIKTTEFNWWVSNGRIRELAPKSKLMIMNLGRNDVGGASLSTVVGVDGSFKKAIKEIISNYFYYNPSGSCVVNSITSTDVASAIAVIASGIYSGFTNINAFRKEIEDSVTEINVAHPEWDLFFANTANAFSSAQCNTNCLSTESAGSYVHPNTTFGQPAMANIIFPAIQLTKFYLDQV